MTERTRNSPPRASAMLETLRGLGYSTAAALADLIDNSLSACAAEVRIDFVWDGPKSRISVLDDGRGMDDAELERAMRLGDRSPLDERGPGDLGRFGIGLKTASFSQCRRLTVASMRKGGRLSCLHWDLDALAARPDDGWLLFEGAAPGSEAFLARLSQQNSGTLVLWENLDRIVTAGYVSDDFTDLVDDVEKRLAMVFHRLLEGPRPKLCLVLNGRPVAPWDPFMSGHPAKQWNSPARHVTRARKSDSVARWTWNRTQTRRDPRTGRLKKIAKPTSEWVITSNEELRIILDPVWTIVMERLASWDRSGSVQIGIKKIRDAWRGLGNPASGSPRSK